MREEIPKYTLKPLGKFVMTTHYEDANILHDIMTWQSVTGILHLVNKTQFDWYSKKQSNWKTATYGSEFVAAFTCTEQIMDIRNNLWHLGSPLREEKSP